MKHIFRILTVASVFAFYSCNDARREQDQDSNEVAEESNEKKFEDNDMEKDADFVAEAVAMNYAEIDMANLGLQKSSNAEVKSIASMLVADHTKALAELKTLAQTKAITVPVEAKDDDKKDLQKLTDEKGNDFDKKWLEKMEDAHDKAINKFEKRADKGEDADIKAFAAKMVPHLKMHKDKIDACQDKMKDNDNNGSK
jgi:putative membrane protein